MNAIQRIFYLAFTTILLVSCGTEDSLSGSAPTTTSATAATASSITLTASSGQINTGSGDTITLTATVKDTNNVLLSGATVIFSSPLADNADVAQTTTVTDSTGTVTGTVSSVDPTNRTISVTATTDTINPTTGAVTPISATRTVTISGTDLAINGTQNLAFDQIVQLTISLTDSVGIGIANQTVALSTGNAANVLSATSLITNSNGQASVSLTAGATDTISATALGASTTFAITVSPDSFAVTLASEINISTCAAVSATWESSGVGVGGQPISFLSTRGNFFTDAGCTVSGSTALTNGSGVATVYLLSPNPGPFTVIADASAVGGPSSTSTSEFIATIPATITLQADDTTISTNDSANLTATVRDSNGNLVKNATINFGINIDATGGEVNPPSDVTDSLGRAQAVYYSTDVTSSTGGVEISASVAGYPSITKVINLTVAGKALNLIVGLANLVVAETSASYAYPGTVLVNDAGGNPVVGANVDIKLIPTYYDKGIRIINTSDIWIATSSITGLATTKNLSCASEDSLTGITDYDLNGTLDTEDINNNGVLDAGEDINFNGVIDEEDFNGNGQLDPGGVATVDTNLTTNADGYATFNIRYPKDFANWAQVRLVTTARVEGSESTNIQNFILVPLAKDVTGESGIVGTISPFGVANDCTNPN